MAVLIDEAQDLTREELTALIAVAHRASQENWRILFALAGLPSLPRVLAEAKSYAERLLDYQHVEKLAEEPATSALARQPARSASPGTPRPSSLCWRVPAVTRTSCSSSAMTCGTPPPDPTTSACRTPASVQSAGRLRWTRGFYRARWDGATTGEMKYLTAIAADHDGNSSAGEVARRLGTTVQAPGPNRAKLIDKGLIYGAEHGVVAFTVPGMAGFIPRQYS